MNIPKGPVRRPVREHQNNAYIYIEFNHQIHHHHTFQSYRNDANLVQKTQYEVPLNKTAKISPPKLWQRELIKLFN